MKNGAVAAGAFLLVFASTCIAAEPGAPVLNPGRQLLEQIQGTTPSAPSQHLAPKAANKSGVSNPNEQKFLILKIEVLGVTKLSKEQLRAIVSRYENRPLGGSDINVLMETLTRAYVSRGYITTRVYLPEQNIKKGVLKLQILEGRLASFSTSTVKKSELFTAFPTQPGRIVRLPDLEQGMDQLERVSSVHAKSEILPGPRDGTSIVSLEATHTFPGHLSFGVDDFGNPITGEWRWLAEAGFDNLLRVNDIWDASYQHSDHSNAVAGNLILPFRWWTLASSASYAVYNEPLGADLNLVNHATIISEQLEQVLFRNAQHRVALSFGFYWTETTREALGDFLTPTRTASFLATIGDTWQVPNHVLSAALTYQEGFPIFGVHQDPGNLRNEDPHAEFQLLKLSASYTDTSHKLVTWHSELNVQYAFEGLLADQQLYLSDPFALRGWSHVTIAADSGVVWRNELILRLSPPVGTEARLSWATLERAIVPYAFNDLGYADSTIQHLHDLLGSAGAGIRIAYGRFTVDGFVAFPYGNLASTVGSPTFYLTGRLTAF